MQVIPAAPQAIRAIVIVGSMAAASAIAADAGSVPGPAPQAESPQAPGFRPPVERVPFELPPLPPASQPRARGMTVVLKGVRFEGNTVIATQELEAIASGYVGRPVTDADIEVLRRKVTERYVAGGFISSGAIAERIDADQTLVMKIVEGRARVTARGLGRLREDYVSGRLVRSPGEVLDIERLRERFQLLLEDPLFARINASVMPGLEPGEAIIDLDVTRAIPYQLTVFANNYRPPSVGANAYGAAGVVRNLTGFGDSLEANVQEPTSGSTNHVYAAWRVPLNRWGTLAWLSYDRGRSVVQEGPLGVLDITSTVDTREAGVSQPLVTTLRHGLVLGASYLEQTEKSKLLGIPFSFTPNVPEGLTEARTWRAWSAYTYRTEANAAVVRVTYTAERNNNEISDTVVGPPRQYHYWLGQFQYAHKLGEWGQGIVRGTVQHADARVLPLDALAIGGVNTVRGFRENQLVRDGGEMLGAQLDIPLPMPRAWPAITASPFFDWGRGVNVGGNADVISSAGLALKAAWHGVRLDFAYGKRLIRPDFVDQSKGNTLQDKGIHIQLAYDVF